MPQTIVTSDSKVASHSREGSHSLSIRTKNEPGVLMRIAQVFARRAFNIDSLVVSESRDKDYARMTIGISGDPQGLDQIIKQVHKLVDVIHCSEHTSEDAVAKELTMIKFEAAKEDRAEAINIIEHFGGKTVDMTHESMTAMICGDSDKIDAAVIMLSTFEIIETVRTGKVVMARGGLLT